MPSAIQYVPPTNQDRNSFNGDLGVERRTRRERYREAIRYYLGNHPKQLPIEDDAPDDNLSVNLVRMTADRTVSFLFDDVPRFETDPNTIIPTEEEEYITRFFEDNGGLLTLTKLGLRGFLSGHNFVQIKPPVSKRDVPKMIVQDPTHVAVFWRADDVADVLWYELRFHAGDALYIKDFVREGDNWHIYLYKSVPTGNTSDMLNIPTSHGVGYSQAYLDELDFGKTIFTLVESGVYTSRIPPIVEWPHLPHPDDYYGLHEVGQKELQDAVNRIASERNRIVRENSDPVDVLTGADADEVESGGNLITVGSPQARVTRLELHGDLPGISTVLRELMETYLAIARVVLLKGEAKDLQRVTNAAVRTLFADALAKNQVLQSAYGTALAKIAKVALLMAYQSGQIKNDPSDLRIDVKFAYPLPTDETEMANVNALMTNMGARSLRSAATSMGDNWAFEQAAMDAEYQQAYERRVAEREIDA